MALRDRIWEQIQTFNEQYPGMTPGLGFLAGLNKTSMETVRKHMILLEREGKIERIIANEKYTSYKIK